MAIHVKKPKENEEFRKNMELNEGDRAVRNKRKERTDRHSSQETEGQHAGGTHASATNATLPVSSRFFMAMNLTIGTNSCNP